MSYFKVYICLFINFFLLPVALGDDLGDAAKSIRAPIEKITDLILGLAYISGIGFGIAAVFKLKQHKDNPTQIPIGTPFALFGISCILVFLPSLFTPVANTIGVDNPGSSPFQLFEWANQGCVGGC